MLNKIMDKDRKKQQLLKSLSDRDWEGDIYTYPHSMAYRLHNGNISFSDVWNGTKELNMYIHIPFCPGKCSYCGLFSLGCADEKIISEYVLALSREIVYYAEILKGARIREMFIGGGTPNMLSLEQLTFLKNYTPTMNNNQDIENSVEYAIPMPPPNCAIKQLGEIFFHTCINKVIYFYFFF